VARHELVDAIAQRGARGRHHVGLGAAGVGDDRLRLQVRQQRREDRACLCDRRRQQHEVGAAHGVLRRRRGFVDDAEFARTRQRLRATVPGRRRGAPRRRP
jgi:hypothetical protein